MPTIQLLAPTLDPLHLTEAKTHLRVSFSDDDQLISRLIPAAARAAETILRRALVMGQYKLVLDRFPTPSMEYAASNWYGPSWGSGPGPLTVQMPRGKTGFEIVLPVSSLQSVDSIKYLDNDGIQQTLAPSAYKVDNVSEPPRITPAWGTSWPTARNDFNSVELTFTAGYTASLVADATANTLTARSFGKVWSAGDVVRLSNSGGAPPAPLKIKTDYFVVNPAGATFQVSATSGGSAIDLTDAGTGNNFVGPMPIGEIPEGILQWMLLHMDTLYENRPGLVIDKGATMVVMPTAYVDGLLDPYRVFWFN